MGRNLEGRFRKIEKARPAPMVRIEPLSPEASQFLRIEARAASREAYDHVRACGGDRDIALETRWETWRRLVRIVLSEGVEAARVEIERLKQERPPLMPGTPIHPAWNEDRPAVEA